MTKPKPKNELKNTKATAAGAAKTQTPVTPTAAETKVKQQRPEVVVTPSACPGCGSTEREGYEGTKARKLSGVLSDGRAYQTVVWKPTKCRGCGQNRVDVYHLNRAYKKSDGELIE